MSLFGTKRDALVRVRFRFNNGLYIFIVIEDVNTKYINPISRYMYAPFRNAIYICICIYIYIHTYIYI
jgi:hypothetical protein